MHIDELWVTIMGMSVADVALLFLYAAVCALLGSCLLCLWVLLLVLATYWGSVRALYYLIRCCSYVYALLVLVMVVCVIAHLFVCIIEVHKHLAIVMMCACFVLKH